MKHIVPLTLLLVCLVGIAGCNGNMITGASVGYEKVKVDNRLDKLCAYECVDACDDRACLFECVNNNCK